MYRGASMRGRSFGPRGGPPSMGYARSMGGPRSFGPRSMGGPRSFGARSMRAAPRSMGSMGTMGARRPMGAMPAIGGTRRRRYQKRSNTCAYIAVTLVAVAAICVIFRCEIVQKTGLATGARFMVENEGWLFCDGCKYYPDDSLCAPCEANRSLTRCQAPESQGCKSFQVPSEACTCEEHGQGLVGCKWNECKIGTLPTRDQAIANMRALLNEKIVIENVNETNYPMTTDENGNQYRLDHFGGLISAAWRLPQADDFGIVGGANTTLLMRGYFSKCTMEELQPGDILIAYGYAIMFEKWVGEVGGRYKMLYGSQGSQKVVEYEAEYPHLLDKELGQYYVGADLQPFCIKKECMTG